MLPARPVPPTPRGLALALDLPPPGLDGSGRRPAAGDRRGAAAPPRPAGARSPLNQRRRRPRRPDGPGRLALGAGRCSPPLGDPAAQPSTDALRVWLRLPEWEEQAPPPPPGSLPVAPAEARDPARRACSARTPSSGRARPTTPAPPPAPSRRARPSATRSSCWPRPAPAPARPSATSRPPACGPSATTAASGSAPTPATCSGRSTPRLTRLFPDPAERRRRVVVRKGRENYLCLLNFQEQVGRPARRRLDRDGARRALGRWRRPMATSPAATCPAGSPNCSAKACCPSIADRRGECIHGACPHYRVCFVEHTIRRARAAELVVANHALVMSAGGLGRARRQRGAEPLRVRRRPPRVRRRGQRLRGRAVRRRGRRTAPLAAGRGGRPVPCPRPAAPAGRLACHLSATGRAPRRGVAGGARPAGARLVQPAGRRRPRSRKPVRARPPADPGPDPRPRHDRSGHGRRGMRPLPGSSRTRRSGRGAADGPSPGSPSRSGRCRSGSARSSRPRRTRSTPASGNGSRRRAGRSSAAPCSA